MMFLDPDIIVKRTAIGVASLVVAAGFGLTYYFANDFNKEIKENKTEAANIKEKLQGETTRLSTETDSIKTVLTSNTRELKTSIMLTTEDTKKLDNDLRAQSQLLKQLVQDYDKYKVDTKTDFNKLRTVNEALLDHMKSREQYWTEQIKIRDNIIEKNKSDAKADMLYMQDQIRLKEKDILELKIRLDREIEWRNKYFYTR